MRIRLDVNAPASQLGWRCEDGRTVQRLPDARTARVAMLKTPLPLPGAGARWFLCLERPGSYVLEEHTAAGTSLSSTDESGASSESPSDRCEG